MITISEILTRLGERGRDLNHVKCPCHDDSNGSLVIKQMDSGKIAIKCMAGCEITDICEAIGITVHDLYNGTDGDAQTAASRAPRPKPEKKPESKPEKPKAAILWNEGSVDYEYRSTDGGTRLMKRRWKKSDGGKSFTWDWWDGQRWQHGTNGTQAALYHADELPAAIAAGREIYLVEGEKDCDNWRALGFACTSAPHGAQKGNDPGGKWMAEHTDALSGADVIIIPDNDSTGRAFATAVMLKLKKQCRRVRMIDLAESFPDLPEHGDISDALMHDGEVIVKERVAALVAAATAKQENVPVDDEREKIIQLYNDIGGGFCVLDGCICKWDKDSPRRQCTFVAYPEIMTILDNGTKDKKTEYQVRGWRHDGRPLPLAYVPADQFAGMRWIDTAWPMQANVMAGNTVRDNLRQAMTSVGMEVTRTVTKYQHTGWRYDVDGSSCCYIHQGGAVGAENVVVDLVNNLENYNLDLIRTERTVMECAEASIIELRAVLPDFVSIPGLAFAYLAPLQDAFTKSGNMIDFVMYLEGKTGTGKSVTSSLLLSHFARYDGIRFPASFNSTYNYINELAFTLKDSLLVVDDYRPSSSRTERHAMEALAHRVIDLFTNGASRNKLNSDSTIRAARPPRSICLMSGEDMPQVNESGVARMYHIHLPKGCIEMGKGLTAIQNAARKGVLLRAMRGYIDWLRPQMADLPEELDGKFTKYREMARDKLPKSHARAAGMVAHLLIGYEMMLKYLGSLAPEVYTKEYLGAELVHAFKVIVGNCEKQIAAANEATPTAMYLEAISSMIESGSVVVQTVGSTGETAPKDIIGVKDTREYFFIADVVYSKVADLFARSGREFPLGQRAIQQALAEEGISRVTKGRTLLNCTIGGVTKNRLVIPLKYIDGQMKTEQTELTAGLTPVPGEDNPF